MIANAYVNDSPFPVSTFVKADYPTLTDWILAVVLERMTKPVHYVDGSWVEGDLTIRFVGTFKGPDGRLTSRPIALNGAFVR